MNLKVMNRMAVGTLFATALCLSGCNHSKNKPVDTTPDTDTVEFVKDYTPEEASNVEEISFEPNKKAEKRCHWSDNMAEKKDFYQERGTYGTTMLMQRSRDLEILSYVPFDIEKHYKKIAQDKVSENISTTYHAQKYDAYEAKEYIDAENKRIHYDLEIHDPYVKEYGGYLERLDEQLYTNGPISGEKCSAYLDRQLAGLNFLTMEEYEQVKKDIDNFEKLQKTKTTQSVAELIAYKQFKLDSLNFRHLFEDMGLIKNFKTKQIFDARCKEIRPMP